ncbi:hypothetical protein RclHR1_03240019 [Rhizophagus clarus]|nr:hypothetical protein RclHR1_03240019 [Rhizophagus clarus]
MLKIYEWNLLDKLIELFKPIEDATEFLGGQKYCTLSLIYPTIQALKYSYAINDNDNNNEINEGEGSDNEDNDDDDKDSNKSDNENDDDEQNSINSINSIDKQVDITAIINSIKEEIYNALYNYFDNLPNATILASILDPRSKQMHEWPEELKEKTISLLRSEYKKEKQESSLKEMHTNTLQANHKDKTFASCVFGFPRSQIPIYEELFYYLDEIKTPQVFPEIDPFEW